MQIAADLETVNGIIVQLQQCHEDIGDLDLSRQRLFRRTEELRVHVRAPPQRITQLFRRMKELRVCVKAAKNALLEHGFTGQMPTDIQLYCRTTYCHSTCRYCYCDRPHNCYSALHAATATATVTATDR